jgi:hypothetical protein
MDEAALSGAAVRRVALRLAAAGIVSLAALAPGHAQSPFAAQRRAQVMAAIETYRGAQQKFEQSSGPLAPYAGLYSRGYRCEYDERAAGRLPGMWEKTQFALWSDDKRFYEMQLDASPAVFEFEYKLLQDVIGADLYEMKRVDSFGPATGIDDAEWRIVGFGIPNPDDVGRIGIRIPPDFFTHPDVRTVSKLTLCGRGGDGGFRDPLTSAVGFLQRRLATLPAP